MASIESEQFPAAADQPSDRPQTVSDLLWELAVRVYIRVAIILTLYVLSIGPMFWHWHESRFMHGEPFFAKLYYPLELLAHAWPAFGRWVDWYVNLWIT